MNNKQIYTFLHRLDDDITPIYIFKGQYLKNPAEFFGTQKYLVYDIGDIESLVDYLKKDVGLTHYEEQIIRNLELNPNIIGVTYQQKRNERFKEL